MSFQGWGTLRLDSLRRFVRHSSTRSTLLPPTPVEVLSNNERAQDDSIGSVDTLRRLQLDINLYRAEIEDRRRTCTGKEEEPLKSALAGGWEVESSSDVAAFLQRRRATFQEDLIFSKAEEHFAFNDEYVTMYKKIGSRQYNNQTVRLSQPYRADRISFETFIAGGSLKTIYHIDVNNGDEKYEERFIQDDRLHIVIKRFGMSCTRVYRRIESLEENGKENQEIVSLKREHPTNSKEKVRKTKIKKIKLFNFQEIFNLGNHRKFPYNFTTNIEHRIVGLWRELGSLRIISIKVNDLKYSTRWSYRSPYTLYVFNEKNHVNDCTVTIEDNMIIMRKGDEWRREKVIVRGKLIISHFDDSKLRSKWVYERIGEPLP